MSQQGVDSGGALLLEEFGGAGDGVGGVGEVVDEDGEARGDIAHEHHGGVLAVGDLCGPAFLGWGVSDRKGVWGLGRMMHLVDQGEGHTKPIGDGGGALRSAGIRTDDHSLLVVGDVVLDVLLQQRAAVEVVDGDVEKALILRVV